MVRIVPEPKPEAKVSPSPGRDQLVRPYLQYLDGMVVVWI